MECDQRSDEIGIVAAGGGDNTAVKFLLTVGADLSFAEAVLNPNSDTQ